MLDANVRCAGWRKVPNASRCVAETSCGLEKARIAGFVRLCEVMGEVEDACECYEKV